MAVKDCQVFVTPTLRGPGESYCKGCTHSVTWIGDQGSQISVPETIWQLRLYSPLPAHKLKICPKSKIRARCKVFVSIWTPWGWEAHHPWEWLPVCLHLMWFSSRAARKMGAICFVWLQKGSDELLLLERSQQPPTKANTNSWGRWATALGACNCPTNALPKSVSYKWAWLQKSWQAPGCRAAASCTQLS